MPADPAICGERPELSVSSSGKSSASRAILPGVLHTKAQESRMTRSEILVKLDELGILSTPQRLEIAKVLLREAQHLSAEQILDSLRAAGSRVSKATVYNTLKLFTERGLISECVVDPERRFYDSTTDPHHHFYNVDTGVLTDIPPGTIRFEALPDMPDNSHMESVEVVIKVRQETSGKLA